MTASKHDRAARGARLPVTVVIPVKNEEANLGHCLERLGQSFDEVVVVDSSSTDRTADIARDHGVAVVNFVWDGRYPKKRNWFLETYSSRNDWHLFLDADELVCDRFKAELEHAVRADRKVGYWIHYTNYFLGRALRYGIQQRKLALFRKSAGRYEKIDEQEWSSLDMEVHEHPQLEGEVGEIGVAVDHRDLRGVSYLVSRHIDYAAWEASRYRGRLGFPEAERMTLRQRLKYKFLTKAWFPYAYFLVNYVFKGGFFDGRSGLEYSLMKLWYFNLIRLMIYERDIDLRAAGAAQRAIQRRNPDGC